MLLDELFITEQEGEAAIIFGRFNPPHQGHVAAWKEAAKSPIWYVGTNQSTIGPKDPLPFDVKIKAMEIMWPEVKGHIIPEQTWWSLAAAVYAKHGEVDLKIVTDEQDAKVFVPGLQKQNGVEGRHGFYKFKSIEWRPAPRVSSATDLRAAVAANDPEKFSKAAGVSADTMIDGEKFFDLVKHYLDAQAKPVKEGDLEANSEDPVIVVSDAGGRILDKLNLSVAAQKYGLGNPGTIKQQLAHQAFTKIKNYTISAPMAGQPVAENIAYEPDEKGLQHMALTMPQNAVVIDTPGDLDWYKLGHDIANLQMADPHEYGQSDSDMVIIPSSKEEMDKLLPQLDRLGLKYKLVGGTHDQPEIHGEKPSGVTERIVKVGSKFRLVSKKSGKNLGTYDTKEEAKKRERQVQYFKHVNETGGVGVVANNPKQAKDPRYSTSITADIKPGETQRQAKKMGFKLDKKGQPPLMHGTAAKNTSPNKAYNLGLAETKRFTRKK